MHRSVIGLAVFTISMIASVYGAERAVAAIPKQAPPTPAGQARVALNNETLGNFESAFGAISATTQVTIAAEGVPFQQSLTPAEASALNGSVIGPDVDLDEEVTLIALAYDYDAERISPRCFLLRKRHSDPNDLPDVTYAEIVHALQAVLGTIDSFMPAQPDLWGKNPVFDFYASLTPDQVSAVQTGLALSELDPKQRVLALSTATEFAWNGQMRELRTTLNNLPLLQDKRTVLEWTSVSGSREFDLEGPFGPNGAIWRFPLGASRRSRAASSVYPDRPLDSAADPTRPNEFDRRLAPGMLSNRLPSTLALGEFAQSITGETESGLTLSVDPAVAEKPICLFGANFTGKEKLIRDIAALYGLRVGTEDKHNFALGLPRRGAVRGPQDVPAELVRLIPPSLVRYESWQPFNAKKATSSAEEPSTPRAKRISAAEANHNAIHIWAGVVTADSYYFPAVKRLRVLTEPSVPTRDSPPIPVKTLGPEPQRLIAIMMLSGQSMGELGKLREYSPPTCFSDLDSMVIKAKINSRDMGNMTNKIISASFGYWDENRTFKPEVASIVGMGFPK